MRLLGGSSRRERGCLGCGSQCNARQCRVCEGLATCLRCRREEIRGLDERYVHALHELAEIQAALSKLPHFGLAMELTPPIRELSDLRPRLVWLWHVLSDATGARQPL